MQQTPESPDATGKESLDQSSETNISQALLVQHQEQLKIWHMTRDMHYIWRGFTSRKHTEHDMCCLELDKGLWGLNNALMG